jgi:hypothetical protein
MKSLFRGRPFSHLRLCVNRDVGRPSCLHGEEGGPRVRQDEDPMERREVQDCLAPGARLRGGWRTRRAGGRRHGCRAAAGGRDGVPHARVARVVARLDVYWGSVCVSVDGVDVFPLTLSGGGRADVFF